MPSPPKRYRNSDGGGSGFSRRPEPILPEINAPFRDAEPDTNEIPLADLDLFLVPARDEKGTSQSAHFAAPPIMFRHIDVILRSMRFPYLRTADFIRHAVLRHIRYCVSIRQSLPKSMVVALEAIVEDARDSEQRSRVEAVIRKIEERMAFHLEQGDHGEAIRLMNVMKTRIEGVPDNYWGNGVKKILDEKFFKPVLSHSGTPAPAPVPTPMDNGGGIQ